MIDTPRCTPSLASHRTRPLLPLLAALLLAVGLTACQSPGDDSGNARTVIEMTAQDYTYRGVPDAIPSGWTTLQLRNEGTETHNMEIVRLPDTVTAQDFRDAMNTVRRLQRQLEAGTIDTAEAGKQQPGWLDSVEAAGGLGHVSPEHTGSVTLHLEPGTYGTICFIGNPNDTPHWALGMTRPFTVTTDSTGASPPEADAELTIANYQINAEDTLKAGRQTIAVHFDEVVNPEEPPYRDVELARLPEGTSVDTVAAWANESRAPAPTDFLGGVIPLSGGTAHLTVDLSPGHYAWVSHASKAKGMMKTFTVE
jgi:hypothetical protein